MTSKRDNTAILFIIGVAVFYAAWMLVQPYGVAPDETMRYDIPMFIYKNGVLPRGDDPALIDNAWGLSYAFFPILSYMISAIFMKVAAVLSAEPVVLLMAARSVSLLCGVGTAFMSLKIGRRLFGERNGLLFAVLVAFLPQNVFISSYVNNDALAIFSTALIVWFWIRGIDTGWDIKTCVGLAVSISVCALSYYNAYGFILCSIILFFATVKGQGDGSICPVLSNGTVEPSPCPCKPSPYFRTLLIIAIVFLLAGWFFIRNAILYDGDFLGMRSSDLCAELHAWPEVRPSAHATPMSQGMGVFEMLIKTTWIPSVAGSFIGCFGGMDVKLPMWMYFVAGAFFMVGIILCIVNAIKEPSPMPRVFSYVMLLAAIIPNLLNIYNSYANDYQPQGRYSLPMLIPFFYFVMMGYRSIVGEDKGENEPSSAHTPAASEGKGHYPQNSASVKVYLVVAGCIAFSVLAYFLAFLPAYAGKEMFFLGIPV